MANSATLAEHWTHFVASRPEFPGGRALLAQFNAGAIKSLCDCGCNSYEFTPSLDPSVPTIASASSGSGSVFELMFHARGGGSVEFAVFVDSTGRLAGIDVDYCANSFPMPEQPSLVDPPYHVRVSPSVAA